MQNLILYCVKFVVAIFKFLPTSAVFLVSRFLYVFFRHILRYRKYIIIANLKNSFPLKTKKEIERLYFQFLLYFSDLIVEVVKGLTLPKHELLKRFVYKNPEIFDALFQQNKSAILLGSHYGNWEWGSLTFPLVVKHKVVGIYKPIKNKLVETYLNSLRTKWGLELTSMKSVGRTIIENKGKPVIYVFIADQTPVDVQNAHWVKFLQQDTPFLHGAAKLANQTGYPVFHYQINKEGKGRYSVVFEEICAEPKTVQPYDITVKYAAQLEKLITSDPTYWLWSHRRWKRKRPEGLSG